MNDKSTVHKFFFFLCVCETSTYLPSSFFVLLVRICAIAEQEVGAIGVAQGDGVEEGRAPVVVGDVDLSVAKADLKSI